TSRGGETKSTNRRGRSSVVRTRGGGAFAMAWRSLRPEKLTYAKPTSCTRKKGTTIVAFHAPLANPGVTIVLFHSAPSAPSTRGGTDRASGGWTPGNSSARTSRGQ